MEYTLHWWYGMEISFCFFYRNANFLLKLDLDNPYEYHISKSVCIKIRTLIAYNNTKTKEMLKNIYQVATYRSGTGSLDTRFKKNPDDLNASFDLFFFGKTAFLLRHVFEKSQSIKLHCKYFFSFFNNVMKEFVSTNC